MSKLSISDKTILEATLGMGGGYVLDFSNTSFAQFFDDLGIDIFDDRYAEHGVSKANRLRGFWRLGTDQDVASSLTALADYVAAKRMAGGLTDVTDVQIARAQEIANSLADRPAESQRGESAVVTTEATVTNNRISIEIHEDIYGHIAQYLSTGDFFHAVEESYKVVREKLRELTGDEAATEVFNANAQNNKHFAALFGKQTPRNQAEGDFFRGVGYLHLGIQFLRNEKAHSLATFVEPNLAIHYISLASLAYDLITRNVDPAVASAIEALVKEARDSYSATKFYQVFIDAKWLDGLHLPASLNSKSVRRVLKEKWLAEADLTRSYDASNIVVMQLQLVANELTEVDVDSLLDLPTKDSYGNEQAAGLYQLIEFMAQKYPEKLSNRANAYLNESK